MKKTIFKLGEKIKDNVTKIDGILTVYVLDMSGNEHYYFQPAFLNEEKQPADAFWLTKTRVVGGNLHTVELPVNVLNSLAKDTATGFEGKVTTLEYHQNGCIHVDLKPEGINKKTGKTIATCSFDLRRLEGKEIVKLSEKALAKSKVMKPSPIKHSKLKFNS